MKNLFPCILLLGLLLVGCNDDEIKYVDGFKNSNSQKLVNKIQTMQNAIDEGYVLRYGTKREIAEVKEVLYRFKAYTLRLNSNPKDKKTTKAFYLLYKKFESLEYVERDTGFFLELVQEVRKVLNKYASAQGLDFSDLSWTIYKHAFVDGIKPFKSHDLTPGGAIWEMALGKFAKIGGRGTPTENWLISPAYSTKGISRLNLIIKHTVRNPLWDKFQVYVSSEFDGKTVDINQWHELNITPDTTVPENKWFDLVTKELDLHQFLTGKPLHLAFRYRSDTENNTVWEILSVDFKGTRE